MLQWIIGTLLLIGMIPVSAEAGGAKEASMSSTGGREIAVTTVFDNCSADLRLMTRWGFAAVISTA
jgi:hypothetical protein